MKQLTTKHKGFILEFKYSSAREAEMIDSDEANGIMDALQDKSVKYIERSDENGNFKELLDKKEIKGVKKMHTESAEDKDKRWICGWGYPHEMHEGVYIDEKTGKTEWTALNCGCAERFGCPEDYMRTWLQKHYNIQTMSDTRKRMHDDFLKCHNVVDIKK